MFRWSLFQIFTLLASSIFVASSNGYLLDNEESVAESLIISVFAVLCAANVAVNVISLKIARKDQEALADIVNAEMERNTIFAPRESAAPVLSTEQMNTARASI
jgi:hypothetical protein